MSPRPLFNEYYEYTLEGINLFDEVRQAVKPIVDKFIQEGFDTNDIRIILIDSLQLHIIFEQMRIGFRLKQEKIDNDKNTNSQVS